MVASSPSGGLLRISADGEAETLLGLDPAALTSKVIEEKDLVIVPIMMDGLMAAYRIE